MFYGNNILEEHSEPNFDIVGSLICESVCMTEYHNRLKIYENCTDEAEKAVLESQLSVLYEITIKDIGEKILGALKKVWEFIKGIGKSIKNFFTRARIKELEARSEQLEKEVEKLLDINEDLRDKNDVLEKDKKLSKDENKILRKDLKEKEKENKELENKNKDLEKDLEKTKEERDKLADQNEKRKSRSAVMRAKIDKIIESAVENKYIYFDPYDYLTDNGESSMNNLSSDLKSFSERLEDNGVKDLLSKFGDQKFYRSTYYIIKDDILNTNKGKWNDLRDDQGGSTHIGDVIEDHLDKKAEKEKEQWLPVNGKRVRFFKHITETLHHLDSLRYNSLELSISKNIELSTKIASAYYNKSENTSNDSDEYDNLKASYKIFNSITGCLRKNSVYLAAVCKVLGKSVGACAAFVNSISIALGYEKIQIAIGNAAEKASEKKES